MVFLGMEVLLTPSESASVDVVGWVGLLGVLVVYPCDSVVTSVFGG